jgi:hypothetical protein
VGAETFQNRDLTGSRFDQVDLSDTVIHNSALRRTRISGSWLQDVDLSGDIKGQLLVNGVDVAPYVETELNRRWPERALMHPTDADRYREAWPILERRWSELVERARRLPEPRLHERVDGEWSFLETLRHLVFATDAWVRRVVLGEAAPFHPWGVPHTEEQGTSDLFDEDADPSLDEVVAIRNQRQSIVGRVIAELTDEELQRTTDPNPAPGYPDDTVHPVSRCLGAIINEEWEHSTFAERDLTKLDARA